MCKQKDRALETEMSREVRCLVVIDTRAPRLVAGLKAPTLRRTRGQQSPRLAPAQLRVDLWASTLEREAVTMEGDQISTVKEGALPSTCLPWFRRPDGLFQTSLKQSELLKRQL